MKILIINDTSISSQMGCQAVMSAFRDLTKGHNVRFLATASLLGIRWKGPGSEKKILEQIPLGVRDEILWSDIVILNGEGSIHHNNHIADLAILSMANSLGKKTWMVNAVFERNDGFHKTLGKIDKFIVRERHSLDCARGITDRVKEMPDVFWNHDMSVRGGDRTYITCYHNARKKDVGLVLDELRKEYDYISLGGGWGIDWKERLVEKIDDAGLIITGRHHGVYLAAKLGIPFIAMGSNTHKVEGIIKSSGCDVPFCKTMAEVKESMDNIDSYDFEGFRKFMDDTYKYPELFESLK